MLWRINYGVLQLSKLSLKFKWILLLCCLGLILAKKRGGGLAYSFKLPYGLRKEGNKETLIHISEINPLESGLKCNCVCPSCGERLQAKLPKTKEDFTPRFAHHNSDTCAYATETAIHMKAKEIIENAKHIMLPRVVADYKGLFKEVSSERVVEFDRIVLEKRVEDIIPDILAYKDEHALMIEITITHGIDDEKLKKIERIGISTIEIVLSDMDTNFDPDFLYKEIIHNTKNKYWVYNTLEIKERETLKEQYLVIQRNKQEEERRAEEMRKWIKKQNEVRREGKAERINQLLDLNNQVQLKQRWSKEFYKDPIWLNAAKGMSVTPRNIPEYINVEVPGEIVFGCDRRVWQAYIFYRYVYNKVNLFRENTYPTTIKRIIKNIKEDFRRRLIWDLVYLKDVNGYNDVPDLTKVIYDYLKKLEGFGYLTEEPAGNIFYSKFIILDPKSVYEMRFIPTSMPEYKKIESMMKNCEWQKCRDLIIELLIKYEQCNQQDYYNALAYLFDSIVVRTGGVINRKRS